MPERYSRNGNSLAGCEVRGFPLDRLKPTLAGDQARHFVQKRLRLRLRLRVRNRGMG